ncbi:MAG: chemotaxis protein CheA [Polyangiaceae bacterium]|nr:chemotaxis protein CheA [Polyangiaceae bacterium]
MVDSIDKARDEFFSEAQEIIETYSRNLLAIDESLTGGHSDPTLVNEVFRAVHTLKGLAGLFGATAMGSLAHHLEDLLDDLRLGRAELTRAVLDLLFSSIDVFGKILEAERGGSEAAPQGLTNLLERLAQLAGHEEPEPAMVTDYELDPGMLAVLTEYEEHRLRSNLEQGLRLYRLRVKFDLATLDKALEEIKERAKRHGEIITYLPTGESSSIETIELDLLMASHDDLSMLIGSLASEHVIVEEVARKADLHGSPLSRGRSVRHEVSLPALSKPLGVPEENAEMALASPDRSLRSLTQTVRVDIRKLDRLMNIVGELAIVRSVLAKVADRVRTDGQPQLASELLRVHRNFERRLTEMQDGILEVRMVPLGQVFERLSRVVRQIGRELNKEIRFVITGAETEIDKLIVEELSDPLMHMIRNSIDHGIESAAERARVGKPNAGTIALNAFQKGNHVVIEIEDDGRGIDENALLQKALRLGKINLNEREELSREEILGLIFLPGVSTREVVDDVSGRGVGMDVVKTNISHLGGVIDVQSEPGIGTKMTITLPITLAIVSALLVKVGQDIFAMPLNSVSEALSFDGRGVRVVDGREVMTLRGQSLPLCRLARVLCLPEQDPRARKFVVVASVGSKRMGILVDYLIGQQDIVIKPLGKSLAHVRGFSGATELGDQRVGLVLDPAALIEEVLLSGENAREKGMRAHG